MRQQTQDTNRSFGHNTFAIVDIGSNSVRLVVYEGRNRVPAIAYNEKVMCGLGRNVVSTGLLPEDGVFCALKALARFRTLCQLMKLNNVQIMATAAVRDAKNGADFIKQIKKIWDVPIELISGEREAYLSTLGIMSGFYQPDGIVGDLGGGSLELSSVAGRVVEKGVSLPLGGLALQDLAQGSLKEAYKITHKTLKKRAEEQMLQMQGRSFYAIGGTWRALAKIHQDLNKYPVHFMHGYVVDPEQALKFLRQVERGDNQIMKMVEDINEARRPLLAYGALVLHEIIKQGKPKDIVVSATGVRDGMMFEHLGEDVQGLDPLIDAAERMSQRRSRSAEHGYDLNDWLQQFMATCALPKLPNQERMIKAACLLSDLSWRAHPDYRAEHSLAQVGCAYFLGVDHPTRAYLALSAYCRYAGVNAIDKAPGELQAVAGDTFIQFARLTAAAMRIGYSISVAMAGVLTRTPLVQKDNEIVLTLPRALEQLANGRLINRLRQLGKLMDRPTRIDLEG